MAKNKKRLLKSRKVERKIVASTFHAHSSGRTNLWHPMFVRMEQSSWKQGAADGRGMWDPLSGTQLSIFCRSLYLTGKPCTWAKMSVMMFPAVFITATSVNIAAAYQQMY